MNFQQRFDVNFSDEEGSFRSLQEQRAPQNQHYAESHLYYNGRIIQESGHQAGHQYGAPQVGYSSIQPHNNQYQHTHQAAAQKGTYQFSEQFSRPAQPHNNDYNYYQQQHGYESIENQDLQNNNVPQKAVQLVQVKENGTFAFTQEAREVLEQYEGNVAFVAVAGKYRTGKSFLLNKLLDIQGRGFKVDAGTHACTQGIWMWSRPLNKNGLHIFFIDTEGSSSVDKEQRHDAKIFALAILCSSYFVFNSQGCIDELAMQELQLTTTISKNIAISQYGNKKDQQNLSQYAPKFMWVLRDFVLEIQDQYNRNITSQEYLENALLNDTQSQKTQQIRMALCDFFKDRDCVTMVRPVEQEKDLQILDSLPVNQIRREFMEKIRLIKSTLMSKIGPKTLNGVPLNARMFCAMLESFIEKINDQHGIPSIATAWEAIVEKECVAAQKQAQDLYLESLQLSLGEDRVLSYYELFCVLRDTRDQAINQYENVAGIKEKNEAFEKYKSELDDFITKKEKEVICINEDMGKGKSQDVLNSAFMELNLNINRNLYSSQKIEEFHQDYKASLQRYNNEYEGPQKGETLGIYMVDLEKSMLPQLMNTLDTNNIVDRQQQEEQKKINQQKIQDIKSQININTLKLQQKKDLTNKLDRENKQLQTDIAKFKKEYQTINSQMSENLLDPQVYKQESKKIQNELQTLQLEYNKAKNYQQELIQKGYKPANKKRG